MPLYTPVFFDRFEPNTTNFIFHDFGRNINPAKKKGGRKDLNFPDNLCEGNLLCEKTVQLGILEMNISNLKDVILMIKIMM